MRPILDPNIARSHYIRCTVSSVGYLGHHGILVLSKDYFLTLGVDQKSPHPADSLLESAERELQLHVSLIVLD